MIGQHHTTRSLIGPGQVRTERSLDDIFSESVRVSSSGGAARVVQLDMVTQDGVVHAIDTVI